MLDSIIKSSKEDLKEVFNVVENIEEYNSKKVLDSFIENNICESDLNGTTGYGYNDTGRDKIEGVYASIFKAEASLVRSQFISGTHAISTCLFAFLIPCLHRLILFSYLILREPVCFVAFYILLLVQRT